MLQGLPPNMLPFYRYQPGMPPQVQGGMMAAQMFNPGPNVYPQQMGSPHLGQQPGPQGPNGSEYHDGNGSARADLLTLPSSSVPMYFTNSIPPNAHFLPPQMHFHPNGPGRPGPGPMYFQGGQMPQQQQQSEQNKTLSRLIECVI